MADLERPKKGEKLKRLWTYVDAAVVAIQSLLACDVKIVEGKDGEKPSGKFVRSDANTVLTLRFPPGAAAPLPTPPPSGTYFLGSVDGKVKWIDSTDCSGS